MSNNKDEIIIVGDSPIAEVAYEYFTHDSPHEVVAFSVEKDYIEKNKLFGLPIIPFENIEEKYKPNEYKMFIAVGYTQLNRLRARFFQEAKEKGFSLVSYVSSKAFIWKNVEIGENCFIFENNVVQPFVKIGDNVTIWSGNHIGHHSTIKDHCFISSHVVVSGFVEVGEYCFLGVNSTIINNLKIAKDCLIGAGVTILRDAEEGKVYGSKMASEKDYSSLSYFGVEKN